MKSVTLRLAVEQDYDVAYDITDAEYAEFIQWLKDDPFIFHEPSEDDIRLYFREFLDAGSTFDGADLLQLPSTPVGPAYVRIEHVDVD